MKGRKPKPTEQKRREGNAGKRKLPEPVQIAPVSGLARPDDLPAEALQLWDDIVDRLHGAGILDLVDRPALTALCVQWARAERARKVLAQEGFFTIGSMGQLVEHPALSIERQAHALFLRFAEHYGLTAAARARIVAAVRGHGPSDEIAAIVSAEPETRRVT